MSHLESYIQRTKKRRGASNCLFITKIPPYRPAKLFTIRKWIVEALKEAGISQSAGSTRSAAATFAAVSNISLSRIMEAADWSRSLVMFRHYIRLLPPEVLKRVRSQEETVQAAVLNAANVH